MRWCWGWAACAFRGPVVLWGDVLRRHRPSGHSRGSDFGARLSSPFCSCPIEADLVSSRTPRPFPRVHPWFSLRPECLSHLQKFSSARQPLSEVLSPGEPSTPGPLPPPASHGACCTLSLLPAGTLVCLQRSFGKYAFRQESLTAGALATGTAAGAAPHLKGREDLACVDVWPPEILSERLLNAVNEKVPSLIPKW